MFTVARDGNALRWPNFNQRVKWTKVVIGGSSFARSVSVVVPLL
ncbi:hypothetical protein [Qaidamihabitans albus]|nr:hypothetical protein [Qaidamihabitans albus]